MKRSIRLHGHLRPASLLRPAFLLSPASALAVLAVLALVLSAATEASAKSPSGWSEFHGDNAHGVATGHMPLGWNESDYVWRRNLGSRDVGSPVVHDQSVFLMVSKPNQQKIAVESIDLVSGDLNWSKEFDQAGHHQHRRNTYASSTPAVDAENVFVAWSDPNHTFLVCLDHAGNVVWKRDFGSWQSQHGFGTSPRIFGSMVLLFNSQQADQIKPGDTPGQSRMIAVDRKTGDTVWETPLETTRSCYGIPAIYEAADGTTQIIDANTGNGMFALDAKTGKMLWNLKVFEMRCCSSPLIVGDLVIGSSGSGGGGNHLVAVKIPKSSSDKPESVYRIDRGAPYVPTSVVSGDRLFMVDDKGIASCINAKTGESVWQKRIGGNFGASPILVGQTLLLISLDGKATLLKASDTFEKLGEVDLGAPVGATPAYSQGRLLIRVGEELVCLGPEQV